MNYDQASIKYLYDAMPPSVLRTMTNMVVVSDLQAISGKGMGVDC